MLYLVVQGAKMYKHMALAYSCIRSGWNTIEAVFTVVDGHIYFMLIYWVCTASKYSLLIISYTFQLWCQIWTLALKCSFTMGWQIMPPYGCNSYFLKCCHLHNVHLQPWLHSNNYHVLSNVKHKIIYCSI